MDFYYALAESSNFGLSKAEFMRKWEFDETMKLKAEEIRVLQRQQNKVPNDANHQRESKLETLMLQQFEKLMTEVSHLNKRFDFVEKSLSSSHQQQQQLIEQQTQLIEQQKQLIQQQTNEWQRELKHLRDHLEDRMDVVKTSVTEAINERQGRASESQKRDKKSNMTSPGASYELTDGDLDTLANNKTLTRGPVSQKQQTHCHKEGAITNGHEEVNLSTEDWSMWGLDDHTSNPVGQDNSNDTGASAAVNSNQFCFDGTGEFADGISSVMIQDTGIRGQNSTQANGTDVSPFHSEGNGLRGLQEVSKNSRRRNRDKIPTVLSVTYIPQNGAEFFIPNFKVFQSKSKDFFTESFYTRPRPCNVRLRLWFNKRGRLGVHLLVSEGVFDERHQWPMVFEGNGYIYNQSSQTYTRLWVIESQMCSMPDKKKEITLGASVCLDTSRDPCPDVTGDLLMKKRYVSDGDRLLFRWSIQAVENKVEQQATDQYIYM